MQSSCQWQVLRQGGCTSMYQQKGRPKAHSQHERERESKTALFVVQFTHSVNSNLSELEAKLLEYLSAKSIKFVSCNVIRS